MKLYDMETQEWREGGFKRGDSFRSKQIYICGICLTKTNAILLGGYPGWGVRKVCPGDSFKEHDEIESALKELEHVRGKINSVLLYVKEAQEHALGTGPEDIRCLINLWFAECALLETKIGAVRRKFAGSVDDVVGIEEMDPTMLCEYWPGTRFGGEKKSITEREGSKKIPAV